MDMNEPRTRWLLSTLDFVKGAFADGASETHRREAATVLRAAAGMLDAGLGNAETAPATAPAPPRAAPAATAADPLDRALEFLQAHLDKQEKESQRNASASAPSVAFPGMWPWSAVG